MAPRAAACPTPLSRQEYWSELPFLPPEHLSDSGTKHEALATSPAPKVGSLPLSQWEPPLCTFYLLLLFGMERADTGDKEFVLQ